MHVNEYLLYTNYIVLAYYSDPHSNPPFKKNFLPTCKGCDELIAFSLEDLPPRLSQ